MQLPLRLPPDQLRRRCDPLEFSFETTAELDGRREAVGQKRALDAIAFAMAIRHDGFNLFALGPSGTGKQTALMHHLESVAPEAPVPDDWCHVYNFEKPRHPKAMRLPPGRAMELSLGMDHLVEALFTVIPAAFSSEEYQAQEKAIHEEFQEEQAEAIGALEKKAADESIALIRTPAGFAFAPVSKGEVIKPDEFMKLSDGERKEIEEKIGRFKDELQSIMSQIPKWQRQTQEKINALNRSIADFALRPLVEELKNRFETLQEVRAYLDAVENDIVLNFYQFLEKSQEPGDSVKKSHAFNRYRVNVAVDNGKTIGAPVVYEDKPACRNLVGDIEHLSQMGTLVTDFTLIKAGALHRANGGYLILDARRLLMEPFAWEALKKALRTRQIRIESLGQLYSLISTVSLEPEPIPLELKVILLGERRLYYLLNAYDPDFSELFKVAADFEDELEADTEGKNSYARIIARVARDQGLRHFSREAVARTVEYGGRLAGEGGKLTARLQEISDLVHEADFHAESAGRATVGAEEVEQAVQARIARASRISEKIREATLKESILIDTETEKVGQINGLAVYEAGRERFGHPTRITARIRLGKGEVIDIERETELGGPIHSKGVMILTGFLGARFGMQQPLSLSASLVFEQSYGGVEGDSASSAELYALLSSLSGLPLRQSIAVTGSVNQHGELQAIGGVNEKVEGFFDLCRARGLTGRQGVLIPKANTLNLMLRPDVVEAAARGEFSIYAASHVDEAIELLTGVAAGEPDAEGNWPPESVNGRIVAQLGSMAERLKAFSQNNETPE
ncbi:ATP-binding protein [Chlorobium sp. N1]|uniref:Lon protease family protein n=1 Tax=Chlorobium sp. N1 TaxID=2491138 RepID=UPI0013F15D03|nr:ATP-binding protein [Chlorobium sp. N1]